MIYDSIENAYKYESVIHGLSAVVNAAAPLTRGEFRTGRTPVDGDSIYINAMTYETHPIEGATAEAHRQYADVMIVRSGKETILVCDRTALEVTKEYDPQGDYLLGKLNESLATKVTLTPEHFLVLFPNEVHAPGCVATATQTVEKLVGKIKVG